MARISGVDLPNNKRGEIGLTYIYGIGRTTAKKILSANNIDPATKVKGLERRAGKRHYPIHGRALKGRGRIARRSAAKH